MIIGTSVLMNLLVNGEDASNGYSKYSSHNSYTYPMVNVKQQMAGKHSNHSFKPPLVSSASGVGWTPVNAKQMLV